jgi:hypothetical protein
MSDKNQSVDADLKALSTVYDELSRDARTITRDLSETVAAYFILGFYLLAFSFGLDLYIFLSSGIMWSDYGFLAVWIVFVNVIPISAGSFVLYRYHKLSTRYQMLFQLEKIIRIKEWRRNKETETQ